MQARTHPLPSFSTRHPGRARRRTYHGVTATQSTGRGLAVSMLQRIIIARLRVSRCREGGHRLKPCACRPAQEPMKSTTRRHYESFGDICSLAAFLGIASRFIRDAKWFLVAAGQVLFLPFSLFDQGRAGTALMDARGWLPQLSYCRENASALSRRLGAQSPQARLVHCAGHPPVTRSMPQAASRITAVLIRRRP